MNPETIEDLKSLVEKGVLKEIQSNGKTDYALTEFGESVMMHMQSKEKKS